MPPNPKRAGAIFTECGINSEPKFWSCVARVSKISLKVKPLVKKSFETNPKTKLKPAKTNRG